MYSLYFEVHFFTMEQSSSLPHSRRFTVFRQNSDDDVFENGEEPFIDEDPDRKLSTFIAPRVDRSVEVVTAIMNMKKKFRKGKQTEDTEVDGAYEDDVSKFFTIAFDFSRDTVVGKLLVDESEEAAKTKRKKTVAFLQVDDDDIETENDTDSFANRKNSLYSKTDRRVSVLNDIPITKEEKTAAFRIYFSKALRFHSNNQLRYSLNNYAKVGADKMHFKFPINIFFSGVGTET